jgi:predicted MPP superfamily phosphohydrolase
MAKQTTRRSNASPVAGRRASDTQPAALVNPAQPSDKVVTFSFSSGRHPHIRKALEKIDAVLARTLYRPFMRFMPPAVTRLAIPIAGLPAAHSGITIAHLSDIHHSQIVPLPVIEQVVALTNDLTPDVVFLTGDFVTYDVSYAPACARALANLHAPLGVYAILGNHDYWTDAAEVAGQLRQNGVPVLINTAHQLAGDLWVAGVDDAWSGQPDLDKTLAAVPAGATTILLAHEPDFADQAQGRGIALQLSGHSHGGQVRLPLTTRPVLPFLSWKYYAGLRQVGDLWLHTSRGVGTMQPPFIFTCRPEVALLTLATA